MNTRRAVALALILGGVLALAYGGFTYTKGSHDANLGPLSFSVKDRETVYIPVWAGVVALIVGGALLLQGARRRS